MTANSKKQPPSASAGGADRRGWLPSNLVPVPYSEPGRDELEILLALAPASARAFWECAKRHLFEHRENAYLLFRVVAEDERLLRMALWRMAKEHRSFEQSYLGRGAANAAKLIDGAYRMAAKTGKPMSWAGARALRLLPQYEKLSACRLFDLIGICARHGDLPTAQAMVQAFPDARLDPQDRRLRYGSTGFGRMDFAEAKGRAWARKAVASALRGKPEPEPPKNERLPSNAFFWCLARHGALLKSDPQAAKSWGELGAELLKRAGPDNANSGQLLLGSLACPPMREALPTLNQVTFYCFDRLPLLLEHLPLIPAQELAHGCFKEAAVAGREDVPALAIALLQGRKPDASWRELWQGQAALTWSLPSAALQAAKEGKAIDAGSFERARTGKKFTLGALAQALGAQIPWDAPSTPVKASLSPRRKPKP